MNHTFRSYADLKANLEALGQKNTTAPQAPAHQVSTRADEAAWTRSMLTR